MSDPDVVHIVEDIGKFLFGHHHHHPTGMIIRERRKHHHHEHWEEHHMALTIGGSNVFQEVPTPAGSVFPTGTTFTWTVDDTADVSLTPSADGTQVTATTVATPTGTSANLTCQSSYVPPGATTGISFTVNLPFVAPPPPTPTGMTINQLS